MANWSTSGNALGNPPSGFLGTTDNTALVFETDSKERLRVDPAGNVGIGTAKPAAALDIANGVLHVAGATNPTTTSQGAYLGWNALTGGTGETDFINNQGLGTGGFAFMNAPKSGSPRTTLMVITGSGQVGIGTSNPAETLSVTGTMRVTGTYNNPDGTTDFNYGVDLGSGAPNNVLSAYATAAGALGPVIALTNLGGGQNSAVAFDLYTFDPGEGVGPDHYTSPSSRIEAVDTGNFSNDIVFLTNTPGAANNALVERVRITGTGNLNVSGDVILSGADCAEQFDVSGTEVPEPGTVVVIGDDCALKPSREAYDKTVAGVISGAGEYRHGILLDRQTDSEGRVAVALAGKVYCKVDAGYGAIEVGSLLTTSATPGHAMKAVDPARAFGAVIGKALRPLRDGCGLIPILVSLQ